MLRRVLLLVFLAQIAFAAPAHSGGGGCGEPLTHGDTTLVRMKAWCFGPTVAHVREGAEVTWVNRDHDRHNVVGASYLWGSRTMRFGDAAIYRFEEKGTYPYVCQFHPGMVGAIVVGNGKSNSTIGWRDKAVVLVDFKRNKKDEDASAIPPGAGRGPRISSEPTRDVGDVAGPSEEAWPVEWVVVGSAALLAIALAIGAASRKVVT